MHQPTEPTTSLEQAISASLEAMRAAAAEADRTDYLGNVMAALLDQRPVLFVAVMMKGQTLSWALTPEADTALHAVVSHLTTPDGTTHDLRNTELVMGGKTLADVAAGASWLVREITGEHLSGA
jgi:hypothetical protein